MLRHMYRWGPGYAATLVDDRLLLVPQVSGGSEGYSTARQRPPGEVGEAFPVEYCFRLRSLGGVRFGVVGLTDVPEDEGEGALSVQMPDLEECPWPRRCERWTVASLDYQVMARFRRSTDLRGTLERIPVCVRRALGPRWAEIVREFGSRGPAS